MPRLVFISSIICSKHHSLSSLLQVACLCNAQQRNAQQKVCWMPGGYEISSQRASPVYFTLELIHLSAVCRIWVIRVEGRPLIIVLVTWVGGWEGGRERGWESGWQACRAKRTAIPTDWAPTAKTKLAQSGLQGYLWTSIYGAASWCEFACCSVVQIKTKVADVERFWNRCT